LAIATSLDALAAGVSMPCLNVPPLLSSAIIGGVAFTLSVVGGLAGRELGSLFRRSAHLLGGAVLIAIGIKILLSSLG
jgi:putative Mn2+ efflux pump MntP